MAQRKVLFEGFTDDELLELPAGTIEELIVIGEPLIFRAGSATILGSFRVCEDRLIIELAQIDGGGEGVLVSLASLAQRYARLRQVRRVEWIVHAVACAKPNLKLRKVLERRRFVVESVDGIGTAYHLVEVLPG